MNLTNLITNEINQNNYHFNKLTRNKIGILYIAPVNMVPDDCLACDGYVLKISDYKKLYSAIGNQFNTGSENSDEFRIPDYNITKRFLQPGNEVTTKIDAGLPNITGGWNNVGVEGGYNYSSGAFYNNNIGGNFFYHASGRGGGIGGFYMNASRSSSIYGKSSTVQPPSQVVHICIKYK